MADAATANKPARCEAGQIDGGLTVTVNEFAADASSIVRSSQHHCRSLSVALSLTIGPVDWRMGDVKNWQERISTTN